MFLICTGRGEKKGRRRSKGRATGPWANGGSNLRVIKAWFMARDCLLSSFLLSQFDNARGVLLLLSHLEPTEEQTPHSIFPASTFLFNILSYCATIISSLRTCIFPVAWSLIVLFSLFSPFSIRIKTVLLWCRKMNCTVYKRLLYVFPPSPLSHDTNCLRVAWRRWREG